MKLMSTVLLIFICLVQNSGYAQTASELRAHVAYFASDALEGRDTASVGLAKAQTYVLAKCAEYGIETTTQPLITSRGPCKNVIAYRVGTDPAKVLILGAHLDHVGRNFRGIYNGADDNASGSAVLLGLAKRFSAGPKPAATLVFQWYTGEELGMEGSTYYATHPLFPTDKPSLDTHFFMLNLDMVGHLGRAEAATGDDIDLPSILDSLYEKYPFAKGITLREGGGSDHAPFMRRGVPTVFLHTGLHRHYHQPSDDTDTLNYPGMVLVSHYAYDLVAKLAGKSDDAYVIWAALPNYVAPELKHGVVRNEP